MRTFLLLALTFVAVNGSRLNIKKALLQETIVHVNHVLHDNSDENLKQFVTDIFQSGDCSDKALCQAATVLENVQLKKDPYNLIRRNLFAYGDLTEHRTCSITASVEHPVKVFLQKIKLCCQLIISKPVQHPKVLK